MYRIFRKERLNPTVTLMEIEAERVAKKAEPGQFIILRVNEDGERIPLTVADYDREKGTVTIIFQVVGATTKLLDSKKEEYVAVEFDAPLVGIWSPPRKNAPFVCLEPWYGRCDRNDFSGEFSQRDHIINMPSGETFEAEYEIELL